MHLNKGGPTPRAAHAMCATSNHLVIFGGRDPIGRKNDLYIYDTGELNLGLLVKHSVELVI